VCGFELNARETHFVIASEREAIQLESKEKAQWCHCAFMPIISWIASLTLAMTV
jgi:hypothetical protein